MIIWLQNVSTPFDICVPIHGFPDQRMGNGEVSPGDWIEPSSSLFLFISSHQTDRAEISLTLPCSLILPVVPFSCLSGI